MKRKAAEEIFAACELALSSLTELETAIAQVSCASREWRSQLGRLVKTHEQVPHPLRFPGSKFGCCLYKGHRRSTSSVPTTTPTACFSCSNSCGVDDERANSNARDNSPKKFSAAFEIACAEVGSES